MASTTPASDLIVVVHGIGSHRLVMWPLCARLRVRNFRVANWGYTSVMGSVARHAAKLREYLEGALAGEERLHLVAHSMGAIVVRAALAKGPLANLGRVVFMAPPNTGSPVARRLAAVFGRICQPLADLSDRAESYVNSLPPPAGVEIGVLAARYDLLVPTANTQLAGQREHRLLQATHNTLLISRTAADLTEAFLKTGRFPVRD